MIPAAGLQLLRPALELAWTVARTGEPQLVPGIMRPLMHFAKRPDRALDTTARALEEDDDFRARVALVADELTVGRAGYLFITRPEGWEEELATLIASALEVQSAEAEEQEERSARKRLRAAEEARQRADEARTTAMAEAARATAELADERRASGRGGPSPPLTTRHGRLPASCARHPECVRRRRPRLRHRLHARHPDSYLVLLARLTAEHPQRHGQAGAI